jgi:hypothetical protein
MNTKSFTRLVASTILAAGLLSTPSASTAQAAPFGFTKVPECMNQEALEQIRQLEILEKGYTKWIAAKEAAIPVEQKELGDAEAALQQAVAILGKGANAYPAGFDPVATIDKLQKQIKYLVTSIDDDERNLISMQQELTSVQAWLRADRLLKPCEESYHTSPPPGGDEMIPANDLMNGVPATPPVLADPGLDIPSSDPRPASEIHPQLPTFDPPLHGFPVPPPLKTGSRPLDGFVDPPMRAPDESAKPPVGARNPERPQIGMTTRPTGENHPSEGIARADDAKRTLRTTSRDARLTVRSENLTAHASFERTERPSSLANGFGQANRFGGAGHMGDLNHTGRMGGFGPMSADVSHFGDAGRMAMGHNGGSGLFGGIGHAAGAGLFGGHMGNMSGMGHMARF